MPSPSVADAFRAHERHLWGLAYRMTGSAADADDVVQETFARAIERPPARLDAPLRPWLAHVALNVARDALRRRKRRRYVGPWLPAPVETADLDPPDLEQQPDAASGAEARYDLRESASYAFLVALEALSPQQRAVLLLRDVLDYTVRETAGALAVSEGNVKTTHHRARRAMRAYDRTRLVPSTQLGEATRAALERFLVAIVGHDAAAAQACLAEAVRAVSDGGGEYLAALRPVRGRDRVARFLVGLQKKVHRGGRFALRSLNGLPALVAEYEEPVDRWAPRVVIRCEVDATGMIREVHVVVASAKLTGVRPVDGL
ncbi:MAG TPA: sigma-70 family RNA polymerase sigma factor [Polyangiaceae bacterium]